MQEKNYHTCACGHKHIIDKREIALYQGMIKSLWSVYRWCKEKDIHEFRMRDVRHLVGQVGYTRFGDWVYFGGLVYKKGKSNYGINVERCEAFFRGESTIPSRVLKDPITKQIEPLDYKTIKSIPEITEFLDKDKLYQARYVPGEEREREEVPPRLFD